MGEQAAEQAHPAAGTLVRLKAGMPGTYEGLSAHQPRHVGVAADRVLVVHDSATR